MKKDKTQKWQTEPVAWLVRELATDFHEIAEPEEKASNPDFWSDAFPVFAMPVSAFEAIEWYKQTSVRVLNNALEEVSKLRAQLAEAQALLKHREEMLAKVAGGWPLRIYTKDDPLLIKTCGEAMAYSLDGGMMTTFDPEKMELSASAEPSAPVEREKFTEQEMQFFRNVVLSPGYKLSDCCFDGEGNALWKKLESAGLIECIGSFKWRPSVDVIGAGIRAALERKS